MKEVLKLVLVLTLICAVSAGILALVKNLTQEARDNAKREELLKAIRAVLPPGYDNEPDKTIVSLTDKAGWEKTLYVGMESDGRVLGHAFESTDPKGYGGEIIVMVGITPDGIVSGIEILKHKETPGLGTKIEDIEFKVEFKGKGLGTASWKVKKEGGSFPQFAGATISPRAVVNAVKYALEFYQDNQEKIFSETEKRSREVVGKTQTNDGGYSEKGQKEAPPSTDKTPEQPAGETKPEKQPTGGKK